MIGQIGHGASQRARDGNEGHEADIAFASLNFAHVGSVDPSGVC